MASAARRAWLQEREQEALGLAPNPSPATLLKWLNRPYIIFAMPLALLLGATSIYNLIAPDSLRTTQENRLLEVASLMDDIYSTFANMTFIPPTAIKRGPHHINITDERCEYNAASIRLMELLPYIDQNEVMEKDNVYRTQWLFGSDFIDYREPYHRQGARGRFYSGDEWYQLDSSAVALTLWRQGTWRRQGTWILSYNTEWNSMSVFEGEDYIALFNEDKPGGYDGDYTGIGIFNHSQKKPLAARSLPQDHVDWAMCFDAPTLLRRILEAYQSLAWTPWETSDRKEGWGVNVTIIKDLLRNNGWLDTFDPDQFNVDFIRAKHASSRYGPAQAAHATLDDLEGHIDHSGHQVRGKIENEKLGIANFEARLHSYPEQEYWHHIFLIQRDTWRLEVLEAQLATAKAEIQRLCPNGECVKPGDEILWEFHSIETEYQKTQRATPLEKQCESDARGLIVWTEPTPPGVVESCITNRRRVARWLALAYNQTKAEALRHCAATGCTLLPQPTLEDRVKAVIADFEAEIVSERARGAKWYEWLPNLPEYATMARMYHEMEASAAVNRPWSVRERIEWVEGMMGKEEDRRKLERCLDEPDCL
ncbi:hypothetical protein CC86DRAFT_369887 [Ophiobolus disseminans]|uniref:Uncharacterized protein n=1 Tax=Ophiobolus disseminans TaxID=1469910 RepID=A0A6A7A1W3_9PLEO|nr:hypothetical protein CC86DRAFT_369887 [Ophiobolus disseminans]